MKVAIISPHTDDAIFSLGDSIQYLLHTGKEVTIISPFAGVPDDAAGYSKHTLLRKEHARACTMLGVEIINGNFLDDVYPDRDLSYLEGWLKEMVLGHDRIIVPLGIHHPDHIIVRNIFVENFNHFDFYEELPYRVLYPELRDQVATKYIGNRFLSRSINTTNTKKFAVEAYASQIIGHKILEQLYVPERMWI